MFEQQLGAFADFLNLQRELSEDEIARILEALELDILEYLAQARQGAKRLHQFIKPLQDAAAAVAALRQNYTYKGLKTFIKSYEPQLRAVDRSWGED